MPSTQASKFVALILRHNPSAVGITLDPQGWAVVPDLVAGIAKNGYPEFNATDLTAIVAQDTKQRYSFNADGTKIRANQGHSIQVDLGLQAAQPPATLYHGTATRFLDSIRATGLSPQSRQHVHLSNDADMATKVGSRHGKPVVLTVDTAAMHNKGFKFYQSENGVWLIDSVPVEFLGGL